MSAFTTRTASRLVASTMLAAAIGLPVAAQDVRNLDNEASDVRTFAGTLDAAPARFEVSLPADTSLIIEAISTSSIDPYLTVSDARTGEVLGEDDDSAGNLDARLTIRPGARDRRLAIEVKQFVFGGGESEMPGGTFELRLANYTPKPATPVSWGSTVEGTLQPGAERYFTFTGEAGTVLEVALMAAEDRGLDPYLRLLDDAGEELAVNDDGGGGLNSVLAYLMEDDAPLTIVASAFSEMAGDFVLRVGEKRQPLVQAPLQVIGIADVATGRLGAGHEAGGIDPLSIDYQLSEEALAAIAGGADEFTITMRAKADEGGLGGGLDSYLELGFDTPLGFAVVDSDDDSAGDLDAMVPVNLGALADDPSLLVRLRIRAQALAGSRGDYTLTITEGMEARAVTGLEILEAAEEAVRSIALPAPPPPIRVETAD